MIPRADSLPAHRARLAAVLRVAKEVVSVDITSRTLGIERRSAAKLLSRWKGQGWLRRVGHGLYVAVPLELAGSEQVIADPWVLVPALFDHATSAAGRQPIIGNSPSSSFNEILVFTTRRVTEKRVKSPGRGFHVAQLKPKRLFGLKTLWRGSVKVSISDPARTLVDMIAAPEVGGGIDQVADSLSAYLASRQLIASC